MTQRVSQRLADGLLETQKSTKPPDVSHTSSPHKSNGQLLVPKKCPIMASPDSMSLFPQVMMMEPLKDLNQMAPKVPRDLRPSMPSTNPIFDS
jgi:hypothetical protein